MFPKNHSFIKTFFTFSNKEFSKKYVSYWKECGFNLVSTYTFNPKIHNSQTILDILKESNENGLKVLVSDIRVSYKRLKEVGEETFIKEANEAFELYKNQPSFIGFFLGDEPIAKEIPFVIKTNLILLKINKDLVNFVNFFPYCNNEQVLDVLGCKPENYASRLAKTISEGKFKIWGIDHYGILWIHEQERGNFQYFKTIEVAKEVVKKTNTKCIFAGTTLRHNNISSVNFDMARYQVSIALMNGLHGINWYKLYDTGEGLNSLRNGCDYAYPIDYEGNKTDYFYMLKHINYWLDNKIVPFINDLEYVQSFTYNGETKNEVMVDNVLCSFISDHKQPLLVSKFVDKNNKPYYFAMNLSKDKPEVIIYKYNSIYKNGSSWLLPGEMILISNE